MQVGSSISCSLSKKGGLAVSGQTLSVQFLATSGFRILHSAENEKNGSRHLVNSLL